MKPSRKTRVRIWPSLPVSVRITAPPPHRTLPAMYRWPLGGSYPFATPQLSTILHLVLPRCFPLRARRGTEGEIPERSHPMSAATAATSHLLSASPHAPSSASSVGKPHPMPLHERAFTLHCEGLRSPAIAAELGVPERTIRAWIAADLKALAVERRATRSEQLLIAVERQHSLTVAAWQQFDIEAAARHALLDAALDPSHSSDPSARAHPHFPASTLAPRYLNLILQANKEINRLLGLYQLAKLEMLTPELSPAAIPAESATAGTHIATCRDATHESPAESATPPAVSSRRADVGTPPAAPAAVDGVGALPAAPAADQVGALPAAPVADQVGALPAAPAAMDGVGALPAALDGVGALPAAPVADQVGALPAAPAGGDVPLPAESATAPSGLAAGLLPANSPPPLDPSPAGPLHHIPAESATASLLVASSSSHLPRSSVSSVLNPRLPAESATASAHPHHKARRGTPRAPSGGTAMWR